MGELETMKAVADDLRAYYAPQGIEVGFEYPGFISIGKWNFGTANPTWCGDNGELGDSIDFEIPSDSTDVKRIAFAILKFMDNIL